MHDCKTSPPRRSSTANPGADSGVSRRPLRDRQPPSQELEDSDGIGLRDSRADPERTCVREYPRGVDRDEKKRLRRAAEAALIAQATESWRSTGGRRSLHQYLFNALGDQECDGTLRLAEKWARQNGIEGIVLDDSLSSFGAECDCEVLFQTSTEAPVEWAPPLLRHNLRLLRRAITEELGRPLTRGWTAAVFPSFDRCCALSAWSAGGSRRGLFVLGPHTVPDERYWSADGTPRALFVRGPRTLPDEPQEIQVVDFELPETGTDPVVSALEAGSVATEQPAFLDGIGYVLEFFNDFRPMMLSFSTPTKSPFVELEKAFLSTAEQAATDNSLLADYLEVWLRYASGDRET